MATAMPADRQPACEQRLALVRDYHNSTKTYADSVAKLSELIHCGLDTETDLLHRMCRTAWEAAEKARMALFRHEANHGCNRRDFAAAPIARAVL